MSSHLWKVTEQLLPCLLWVHEDKIWFPLDSPVTQVISPLRWCPLPPFHHQQGNADTGQFSLTCVEFTSLVKGRWRKGNLLNSPVNKHMHRRSQNQFMKRWHETGGENIAAPPAPLNRRGSKQQWMPQPAEQRGGILSRWSRVIQAETWPELQRNRDFKQEATSKTCFLTGAFKRTRHCPAQVLLKVNNLVCQCQKSSGDGD